MGKVRECRKIFTCIVLLSMIKKGRLVARCIVVKCSVSGVWGIVGQCGAVKGSVANCRVL